MSDLSIEDLVDAGAHIGCRVSRWNPKMETFIFEARNRIHIIDLKLTIRGILRAKYFIREVVASGQEVLFVGTKPQIAAEIVKLHEATGMPYVDDRWIGGTLTNYEVIGSRIAYLDDLEKKERDGFLDTLTSKEEARFNREKRKVWRNLHGIRDMFRLPGAMVVVDPKTEINAVREARKMGIAVVGIVDTDGDPDLCDIVIPANDDAIRSVAYILSRLADSVNEGKRLRAERGVQPAQRPVPAEAGVPTPRPRGGARRPPRPRGGMKGLRDRRVEIEPVADRAAAAAPAAPASEAASEDSRTAADETPRTADSAPSAESAPAQTDDDKS